MSGPDESRTPATREEPEKTGLAAIYDFAMQSYCWFAIFFILVRAVRRAVVFCLASRRSDRHEPTSADLLYATDGALRAERHA